MRALVVVGSRHGGTMEMGEWVAEGLRAGGVHGSAHHREVVSLGARGVLGIAEIGVHAACAQPLGHPLPHLHRAAVTRAHHHQRAHG